MPQMKPIRVSNRTGIPLDVLPTRGLTAKQAERMERINDSDLPRVSTQPRNKEEGKDEKRARKQAIKEERKVGLSSHACLTWRDLGLLHRILLWPHVIFNVLM